MRNKLISQYYDRQIYPDCILIDNVFNLVTKNKYWNKPTYSDLNKTLEMLKKFIIKLDIKYLAMPKIGCGLDKLHWNKVKKNIENIFNDLDIEIVICYI